MRLAPTLPSLPTSQVSELLMLSIGSETAPGECSIVWFRAPLGSNSR